MKLKKKYKLVDTTLALFTELTSDKILRFALHYFSG